VRKVEVREVIFVPLIEPSSFSSRYFMLAEPQPLYGFIAYLLLTLKGDQTMSTQLLKQYLYLKAWLTAEEGQDLIEYSLIIALIVIAAIVGMSTLGTKIAAIWGNIAGQLP